MESEEHMTKILVIEDDKHITQILRLYLEQANFTVVNASDGAAGLEMHAREHPDLVILDLMLPTLDGMEVCRRIRAWAATPILMLTARQSEEDRIAGLELGADDYLVKPFSPREVVSRVRAILRRVTPSSAPGSSSTALATFVEQEGAAHSTDSNGNHTKSQVGSNAVIEHAKDELRFGGLHIIIPARRVEVQGQNVTLTAKEFDLLVTLASAPDRVFTRETLLDKIWGYTFLGDGRTVDVHVGTLRKKLDAAGDTGAASPIKTVWGVGYKFAPEE